VLPLVCAFCCVHVPFRWFQFHRGHSCPVPSLNSKESYLHAPGGVLLQEQSIPSTGVATILVLSWMFKVHSNKNKNKNNNNNKNSSNRTMSGVPSYHNSTSQSMDKFQRYEAWLRENGANFDMVSQACTPSGTMVTYSLADAVDTFHLHACAGLYSHYCHFSWNSGNTMHRQKQKSQKKRKNRQ
jgi:hypothetical protein